MIGKEPDADYVASISSPSTRYNGPRSVPPSAPHFPLKDPEHPGVSGKRPRSVPPASASARIIPTPAPTTSTTRPSPSIAPTTYDYLANIDSSRAVTEAFRLAKGDDKNVLLDFGADWCGACVSLNHILPSRQVQRELTSFHMVQIDIGTANSSNYRILQRYDSATKFPLPVLIVVSPEGSVVANTNTLGLPTFSATGFSEFLRKWAA
ncbi:thioredoxin family protein [Streptomyces sp. 1222.5]|uniref:thioredoxin family protein n=1 Tax=Streptomyces sp. 1222.5 TaxID=1881026 RepID=UPI003EBDA97D